jgi:putative transposase
LFCNFIKTYKTTAFGGGHVLVGYAIMPEGEETMTKWKKAVHVVYQCSYHLVWTPKYRYRILQKDYVEKKIRAVREWKHIEILEMTIMPDYVHMVAIIPPKLSVS